MNKILRDGLSLVLGEEAPAPQGIKRKVLVIDDNNDILDLFEIMLYKEYDVVTSVNGFEGLKKAQAQMPDLIITDIMMPVMDGIRFFNQFKKLPGADKVPVIAVTTFSRSYSQKSLVSMGFVSVIPKPFTRDDVLPIIAKATGKE
jgi:CheY-like chemotaxis protein